MNCIFRQLFDRESCTYTYLLADSESKQALLIDPVIECFERDLELIQALGLQLKWVLETHVHADHVTSSGKFRETLGASIAVGEATGVENADRFLGDGETLQLGQLKVQSLLTPGHTRGCTSYYMAPFVFTGDALMIRGCGRTDFQEGSNEDLFKSVRDKIFSLPPETLIYPGHDYNGRTCSSIDEEMRLNPRLGMDVSLEQFSNIMDNLKLSQPKKIDVAVPANIKSGLS